MDGSPRVRITQVAIVVRDLDATMRAYERAFGWGPWQVLDFRDLPHHGTVVRGTPTPYGMRTAVTTVGDLTFEIVEPGDGESQFREFLETKGEGLHHIMCETGSGESRTMAELLRDNGIGALMSGSIGDVVEYTYHDAAALKVTIETTAVHEDGDLGVFAAATTYPR